MSFTCEGAKVHEYTKSISFQVKDSSGESSGSFEDLGDSAKLGDCPTGKYVTHSGPQAKEMVKVVWRAPEHFTATVTVYATVVKVIKKPSRKVADIRLFL